MLLLNLLLVVILLGVLYFIYHYINWLLSYRKLKSGKIPLAYAHYVHPFYPFAEYLDLPTPKERQKMIIETSKKYNTPFVKILRCSKEFIIITFFYQKKIIFNFFQK